MAIRLEPLLPEIVFVGGCATNLLVTDPAAAPTRRTYDVDVIAEIASYADYIAFSERLRALQFSEDTTEGAPVCRWRHGNLILDVMPLDAAILGFSNRWYAPALHAAVNASLPGGLTIRAISAPYFLGTKFEAFQGRGQHDYFVSRDLEDIVAVVDGRPSLIDEIKAAPSPLRAFIAKTIRELIADPRFLDALPGYLLPDAANQARLGQLVQKLHQLSELIE